MVKAGILYKRNSKWKWWKPRWSSFVCTLTATELEIHDGQRGKLIQVINLKGGTVESLGRGVEDGLEWRFCLRFKFKTYFFAASTSNERNEWIEAIQTTLRGGQKTPSQYVTESTSSHDYTSHSNPSLRHSTFLLRSTLNENQFPKPGRRASQSSYLSTESIHY